MTMMVMVMIVRAGLLVPPLLLFRVGSTSFLGVLHAVEMAL